MTDSEQRWYDHGEHQGYKQALQLAMDAAEEYDAPDDLKDALLRAYAVTLQRSTNPNWRNHGMTPGDPAEVLADLRKVANNLRPTEGTAP